MKIEISNGIEELMRQFSNASITARDDDQGGAYVIIEPISLCSRYTPGATWIGFHIPAQYPYADIYPFFIGANIARTDGIAFTAPITPGHTFENRPALQISRRNGAVGGGLQRVTTKALKILDFLEKVE